VETLTLSDGTPAAGLVSLSGDTAVVGGGGVVQLFEREPDGDRWLHNATLRADASGFGQSVATDGRTTVVGSYDPAVGQGAAHVFQRRSGQAWEEVARLASDTNANFGSSVAVSGTTIVVGAPSSGPPGGLVFVFEENEGGEGAWGEVARLAGEPFSETALTDAFGGNLSIDADTVIVGAHVPRRPGSPCSGPLVYVFSRSGSGTNAWSREAILRLPGVCEGVARPTAVSISDDTVAAGAFGNVSIPDFDGGVYVFQRDRIVPNAWIEIDRKLFPTFGAAIDGDFLAAFGRGFNGAASGVVFARNQGGKDGWGEAYRIAGSLAFGAAISGDTSFINTRVVDDGARPMIDVYVADTDRDGLRDGLDACPRDPLNNVEGGCARDSAAYVVLDDLISLGDVTTEAVGEELHIAATFTNSSDSAIGNPFFEVAELSGGNLLVNADGGPGGTGATLSPDVGDGILSPGESTTVTFVVGLATHETFSFFVSVRGDAGP
jgi:hypothetical protein